MKKNKTVNFNRKKIKKIVDELMKETVSTEVFDETCKKILFDFQRKVTNYLNCQVTIII